MSIKFSCPRCQHSQEVDESEIGQQVYCRVCYFKLTVPAESTNKPIDESQLYTLDAQSWDMQDKHELISFPCDLCHTNIGVRKEQVGEEIVCPECGAKIIVPKSIAEKAEARRIEKLDKVIESARYKETYSLSDGTSMPTEDLSKQIRFLCRLCGTALFATEEQVGTFLTCPDCTTKTKVPPQTLKTQTIKTETPPPVEFEGNTAFNVATSSTIGTEKNLVLVVPVVCRLCGTRMYAKESQIGQFKTCPDCGQQTEIKRVPKHLMTTTETTSADAYGLNKTGEPASRPTVRTNVDYRNVEGSLAKELHEERRGRHNQNSSRSFNRPQLPKRPLTEHFFVPFGYADTWLPLVLFVAVIPLGMLAMSWAASATEGGNRVGTFGFAVFTLFMWLIVFIVFVAAFSYFATFLIHFYSFTSSGMDEGEFKGEIAPSDYFVNGLWLFTFTFVAVIPGCLFGNFLHQSSGLTYIMMRISHGFFFPIFFLSSMEEGSMFAVLAKNTIISLFRQPFAWFRFYLLTGILVTLCDLCLFFVTWFDSTGFLFFVSITLFFFLFAIQSLFFFRLLGRLAWLIEETDRQRREIEFEEEEE
jgi:DNA-directed RNA polymerase subunit M/transcription elongation factor TFIIS